MKSTSRDKPGRQRAGNSGFQLPVLVLAFLFSLAPISLMGGIGDVPNGDADDAKAASSESAEEGLKSNREAKNGMETKKAAKAFSEIKCWQKGQLIIHEKNWEPESEAFHSAGIQFTGRGNGYSRMQLAALGETFCYVKTK